MHLEGNSEDNFGLRKATPALISASRTQSTTSFNIHFNITLPRKHVGPSGSAV